MRRGLLLVALAALVLGATVASSDRASAQTPEAAPSDLEIRVTLDPPEARLGERVEIIVSVTHPSDRLVTAGQLTPSNAIEVIETRDPVSEVLDSETTVTEFSFVIAPFELGQLALGSVPITALREDGTVTNASASIPPLTVVLGLQPNDTELRPLKPQAEVAGAPPPLLTRTSAALGAAVLSILVLGTGLVALLRRKPPEAEEQPVEPLSIEDATRRRLDALGRARYLEDGDFEGYYGELSLAVRDHLEARFGFRATALTTRELERRMTAEGVDRWQARLVAGLLQRCDAAVYAHIHPDAASADHDLTVAYEIVELSRPQRELEEVS